MRSGVQRLQDTFDVSRETLDRLMAYEDLLQKWSPKINLVSSSTLDHIWDRHFLDSAQVFSLLEGLGDKVADFGSGGGFPGLVLATIALEKKSEASFTLIESDVRKSAFLLTVIRELGLRAEVLTERVEAVQGQGVDTVTARALASLDVLCDYASLHLKKAGKALFLKGENYQQEVDLARVKWDFDLSIHPSASRAGAALLELQNLRLKT